MVYICNQRQSNGGYLNDTCEEICSRRNGERERVVRSELPNDCQVCERTKEATVTTTKREMVTRVIDKKERGDLRVRIKYVLSVRKRRERDGNNLVSRFARFSCSYV